jgi:hypothetical protein
MQNDIVARLREVADHALMSASRNDVLRAAAEIETLRRVVKEATHYAYESGYYEGVLSMIANGEARTDAAEFAIDHIRRMRK